MLFTLMSFIREATACLISSMGATGGSSTPGMQLCAGAYRYGSSILSLPTIANI